MVEKKSFEPIDVAVQCARVAFGMMERHKVPPYPENFSIWYTYVSGRNAELSAAIDAILRAGTGFSSAVNDELYERFPAFAPGRAELREVGERVEAAVGRVLDYLAQANRGTASYGEALESFSDQLSTGPAPDHLTEAIGQILTETRAMSELNRQLEQRLDVSTREIGQLRTALDTLERESATDSLTQVANRKSFDLTIDRAVRAANQSGRPLCLVMIDIDHFKAFNDTYGHPLGDQILKLVGRSLTETVRPPGTTARYGGEEFAVILPGIERDQAFAVAEDIRLRVAGRRVTNRRTGRMLGQVTLSAGIARFVSGETVSSLIHRADEALYLAKRQGRNRVMTEADLPPHPTA